LKSSANAFDIIAFVLQDLHDLVPEIALDDNFIVFDGAANAAFGLEQFA
jgi:hypothetical protein